MKPTIVRAAVVAMVITAGSELVLGAPGAVADRDDGKFVYAVDVLCQFAGGTTINVHNPNERTVTFIKRGIPLELGQVPTPPRAQQQESLKPDWALLMGCEDILALGGVGSGGMGNVIIHSKSELDVWVVYVSIVAGGGIGETRGLRACSSYKGQAVGKAIRRASEANAVINMLRSGSPRSIQRDQPLSMMLL